MKSLSLFFIVSFVLSGGDAFSLVMMGRRGRKGNLKRTVDGSSSSSSVSSKNVNSINQGRGQEITGVTLPATNQIKGWEFGEKKTMVCANVDDRFYALEGQCPRCAFDLYKGDLLVDDPGWDDLPRIACPTCSTTYSLKSGKFGPPLKRSGLSGFVSGLAKSATQGDKPRDAQAFQISLDEDGRVFCRSKTKSN